jgi:hypothetical protein
MRKEVDQLVDKGYPVKSVDVDQARGLAAKYRVEHVPTFIVVDADGRELARTEGYQPAAQLASFYRDARKKSHVQADDDDPEPRPSAAPARIDDDSERPSAAPARSHEPASGDAPGAPPKLPKPWETVVRIRVIGPGMIGFGSGTIIHSTPEEAIILTCAHIFKIEGARTQPHPSRFPRRIMVDIFDGKLQGRNPAMVHQLASVEGWAIDYDFTSDVGLIRIKPGRRLAASRVVPPDWKPRPNLEMIAVGCPEGNDATAWTTWIVNPSTMLRVGGRNYEAIECVHAPKQGRSGGGLYTTDGYVAGVCDFAEPVGNRGLYAAPRSIYQILDRQKLMALYERPRAGRETLVAQNQGGPKARPTVPPSTLRAQSPELNEGKPVSMPSPEIFGIKPQAVAAAAAERTTRSRSSWHPSLAAAAPEGASNGTGAPDAERIQAIPVEIQIDSAVADPFDTTEPSARSPEDSPPSSPKTTKPSRWHAVGVGSPAPAMAAQGSE